MNCTCGHDFFNHYADDDPNVSGVVKGCRKCPCEGFKEAEEPVND